MGALLLRALEAARETLYQKGRRQNVTMSPIDPSGDPPTLAQQQADALALLAETALHHGIGPGAPGERYQVIVHIDAPALEDPDQPGQSVLEGGARVSAEPTMWLSPLPVALKLRRIEAEGPEVGDVTGADRARRGT